jgi:hypothetical protein
VIRFAPVVFALCVSYEQTDLESGPNKQEELARERRKLDIVTAFIEG